MIRNNLPALTLALLTLLFSYALAARLAAGAPLRAWVLLLTAQFAGLALAFAWMWWRERRSLLRELYGVLETLDEFDPDQPGRIDFHGTREPALRELHRNLHTLIGRIRETYRSTRQFSSNAAHELQTPLAAIKTNVEMLLQSPKLSEADAEALAAILQNTNRLSRLNQALILLSRIENRRFADNERVDIRAVTEEVLNNFQDLIEIQGLTVRRDFRSDAGVHMSATLAEILVANLVQNAIRHNLPGGYIDLRLDRQELTVTNSGPALTAPPEELFRRFRRESTSEDSLGLGLSIVQRICDRYGFQVGYHQEENTHRLTVLFSRS